MVNKSANRHQLRQFHRAADVVGVKVRDEQIVDLTDTGVTGGGGDPSRIASVAGIAGLRLKCSAAGKPRVDEQGLPGWRHEQRGLTPFDVDEVDIERVWERPPGSRQSPARRRGVSCLTEYQ